MENIKQFVSDSDQFARHSGMELLEVATGYAKVSMLIMGHHFNGAKIVHGGAIFTLADFAFAAAANSHGKIAVSINASISFIKAATAGVLIAEAKEISLNSKLGNYIVNITDQENDLIAVYQGTAYRKNDELPLRPTPVQSHGSSMDIDESSRR